MGNMKCISNKVICLVNLLFNISIHAKMTKMMFIQLWRSVADKNTNYYFSVEVEYFEFEVEYFEFEVEYFEFEVENFEFNVEYIKIRCRKHINR